MNKLIFISGPCGCGKTTLADALAKRLMRQSGRTVYVIHGDDFHRGFVEPEDKDGFFTGDGQPSDRMHWEDILRFNWDCLLHTASRALDQGLDVVIDYVIEEELPRVQAVCAAQGARLCYIVLTATAEAIEQRIRRRGDTDMIDRALFLKRKLEAMPENRGHLYDNTNQTPEQSVGSIALEGFEVSHE